MAFSPPSRNTSVLPLNRTEDDQLNGGNRSTYKILGYFVTGFLACAGNMFLCLVFQRKRSLLQKPYNIIIFTLGIIDLLTGLVLVIVAFLTVFPIELRPGSEIDILWTVVSEYNWLEFVFGKASMLLVMCLAFERWFAVVWPIIYRNKFTKRRVYIYIALNLIVALSFRIHELLPDYDYLTMASRRLVISEVVLTTFLPLLITWTIHAHLWYYYSKPSTVRSKGLQNAKQKLLRMSALTAAFITVCWLPSDIKFLIDYGISMPDDTINYSAFYLLSMSNSIVNPFVYYFTNNEYKKEVRKISRNFANCFPCKSEESQRDCMETSYTNQTMETAL